jgi:preprotein translocase subunit SecA
VTVATNMAGRGTDIVLGGYPAYLKELEELEESEGIVAEFKTDILKKRFELAEGHIPRIESAAQKKKCHDIMEMAKVWLAQHQLVKESGGLHIIGTERHEARRIDNQLRGRSGRQGDPGSSRFYLSLEDNLMRIFGGQRIMGLMEKLGMTEGQELEARMVDKAIQRAQKRVENHNFDMRKHLLEYDDVMNRQREFVYAERNNILYNRSVRERILNWGEEVVESRILEFSEGNDPNRWDLESLAEWTGSLNIHIERDPNRYGRGAKAQVELFDHVWGEFKKYYQQKLESIGDEPYNYVERRIALEVIDGRWKEHLYTMDHLREGIWAISYSEKNPLVEYKLEGFRLFDALVATIKEQIIEFLFRVQISATPPMEPVTVRRPIIAGRETHKSVGMFEAGPTDAASLMEIPENNDHKGSGLSTSGGGASRRKSSRGRRR